MSSQDLERMLAAWRDEMADAQAPPRVEAALRDAFRAQAGRRARRSWIGGTLAAAAAIVVAVGVAATWMPKPVAPPPLPAAPRVALPPLSVPSVPLVAKRVQRAPRPRVAPKPQEEVTTEFLPLDDTLHMAPIESGQVLRVEVPRATLVRFGVTVNQERMMEPIKADVVFAQDGIARAIRFVK